MMAILVMIGENGGAEREFPNKPLELIVPFVAGGSSDLMCRTMVVKAAAFLNSQTVMVINKAGVGTGAASEYVLDGKNDGVPPERVKVLRGL